MKRISNRNDATVQTGTASEAFINVQRRGLSAEMIMKHTMKIYTNSPEHSTYLKARFDRTNKGQSFEWAGHRWAYEFTRFDDNGDYDLLYRFDDMPYPEEVTVTADDLTIRDYFAAKFMQGICANPDKLYDDEPLAKEAYEMADAMLRAREAS